MRRRWGYVVWGLAGLAIAVPELWAAISPGSARFPTISGTVGYLEYWHDWVAVIVIGVLAWLGLHAARYSVPGRYVAPARHTPCGRYTRRTPKQLGVALTIAYFAVALVVIVGLPLLVDALRPGDKYLLGETLYGSIGVFVFVLPSLAALVFGRDVPFTTLFATLQNLEAAARPLAVLVGSGIAILLVHLALYPWPAILPDLQDLHKQLHPSHDVKKSQEPNPVGP